MAQPALYEEEYSWEGFYWIDLHDSQNSILSYGRRTKEGGETILVICNFTPVVRSGYRLGVPEAGVYEEIFNTDAAEYGGSNVVNKAQESSPTPWQDHPHSIVLTIPPLAAVYWKKQVDEEE
jgi:1,4-alpha-glucan branching enzyme